MSKLIFKMNSNHLKYLNRIFCNKYITSVHIFLKHFDFFNGNKIRLFSFHIFMYNITLDSWNRMFIYGKWKKYEPSYIRVCTFLNYQYKVFQFIAAMDNVFSFVVLPHFFLASLFLWQICYFLPNILMVSVQFIFKCR